jgi:integrase
MWILALSPIMDLQSIDAHTSKLSVFDAQRNPNVTPERKRGDRVMTQQLKSFTKKELEKLRTETNRVAYQDFGDGSERGLGLFVHPTGNKTFFWFRRVHGVPTRRNIGEFPALSVENARNAAHELNRRRSKCEEDGTAFEQKERSATTFGDLFKLYSDHRKTHAKNPDRSQREEKKRFEEHMKCWENRKMGTITRSEIRDLHTEISLKVPDQKKKRSKGGAVTANRTIQLARRMVNWAIREEKWKGENPFVRLKLNEEKSRDRFAQVDELQRLFEALGKEKSRDVADVVLLALYTGQRRGNIVAMRWDEISITATGQRLWRIPDPKNSEPQVVPLMPEAVRVLAARMKKRGENEFVFPSHGKSGHIRDIKKGWKRLKATAKIDNLTVHDLRRTLGSWMAISGVSLPVIGKVLGHKSYRSTEVYARLQTSAARDAMTLAVGKFPKLPKLALKA